MRKLFLLLIVALSCGPAIARTIENPSDFEVEAVFRHLSGQAPDFEEAARRSDAYRNAGEFDRAAVLAEQIAFMETEFESLKDVDAILIRARARVSEYDSDNEVFYISALEPGSYFPFGRYAITMENSETFRAWPIAVGEAREVRGTLSATGQVITEIMIRPFGVSAGGERRVRGQITSVEVFADDGKVLYEQTLAEDEYRTIEGLGSAPAADPIAADDLVTSGLRLGGYLEPTEEALYQGGYAFVEGAERGDQYGYRPVGFSTDEETLSRFRTNWGDRRAAIASNIMLGQGQPPYLMSVLGTNLDCRGTSNALEKCGYLFVRDTGVVESIIHMQQALGASEETIVEALVARYGQPNDTMPAVVLSSFRGTMLVWGLSSLDLGETVPAVSDISEQRHWQIEAYITEPENGRRVVIVQLNTIGASAEGASDSQIEF